MELIASKAWGCLCFKMRVMYFSHLAFFNCNSSPHLNHFRRLGISVTLNFEGVVIGSILYTCVDLPTYNIVTCVK